MNCSRRQLLQSALIGGGLIGLGSLALPSLVKKLKLILLLLL